MHKIIVNLTRLLFISLIIFEFLNYLNILNFDLDFTWFGLILTSTVVWVGLEIIRLFVQIRCGLTLHSIIWLAAIFAVYFDALGDIFHFYSRFGWYDKIAHLIGSASATMIVFLIFQILSNTKYKMNTKLVYFLTPVTVVILGIAYEIEEYLEDYFSLTNRFGGMPDTVDDVFFNILGILLIFLILGYAGKFKSMSDKYDS